MEKRLLNLTYWIIGLQVVTALAVLGIERRVSYLEGRVEANQQQLTNDIENVNSKLPKNAQERDIDKIIEEALQEKN